MPRRMKFSRAALAWIELSWPTARLSRNAAGDSISFYDGEICISFNRLEDGWVRMLRFDRGEEWRHEYDFASMKIAERHLCMARADLARGILFDQPRLVRANMIHLPDKSGQESDRFEAREVPWQGGRMQESRHTGERDDFDLSDDRTMLVYSASGVDMFRVSHVGALKPGAWNSPVTPLTWYLDIPLRKMLASLKHPTGAPLFELIGDRAQGTGMPMSRDQFIEKMVGMGYSRSGAADLVYEAADLDSAMLRSYNIVPTAEGTFAVFQSSERDTFYRLSTDVGTEFAGTLGEAYEFIYMKQLVSRHIYKDWKDKRRG